MQITNVETISNIEEIISIYSNEKSNDLFNMKFKAKNEFYQNFNENLPAVENIPNDCISLDEFNEIYGRIGLGGDANDFIRYQEPNNQNQDFINMDFDINEILEKASESCRNFNENLPSVSETADEYFSFDEFHDIYTKICSGEEINNYNQGLISMDFNMNENCYVFSCFIGNCTFNSNSFENFKEHTKNLHKDDNKVLQQFDIICESFKSLTSNDKETKQIIKEIDLKFDKELKELTGQIIEDENLEEIDMEIEPIIENEKNLSEEKIKENSILISSESDEAFDENQIENVEISSNSSQSDKQDRLERQKDKNLNLPTETINDNSRSSENFNATLSDLEIASFITEKIEKSRNEKDKFDNFKPCETMADFLESDDTLDCFSFIAKKIQNAKDDKFKNFKSNESIAELVAELKKNEPNEPNNEMSPQSAQSSSSAKKKLKKNDENAKLVIKSIATIRNENKENKVTNSQPPIKNYFKTVEQPLSPASSPVAKERTPKTRKSKEIVQKQRKSTKITPEKPKKIAVAENSKKSAEKPRNVQNPKTVKSAEKPKRNKSAEKLKPTRSIEKPKKSSVVEKHLDATMQFTPDDANTSTSSTGTLQFKNLKELYPWVDEKLTRIVFKTKSSIEVLMSEFCLFSTYKCMNEVCEFFTTDFDEFKKHMIEHSDSNCHYCSFCLKGFEKPSELGTHIDLNHRYDRFQCNNCMYRSCQKGYVAIHQNKFHPKAPCMILKSPVQKLLKSTLKNAEQNMIKNREQFVSSYRCKTPRCKESFYCKTNYRKHLESEKIKPSCSEFGTIIDEQMKEIDHSKTSNKLEGFTECLFCHYGTDEDDILEHMSMNHQSEFAYICKRSMPTFVVARETLLTHTTIEFVGAHPAEVKNFDGNLEKLKSK